MYRARPQTLSRLPQQKPAGLHRRVFFYADITRTDRSALLTVFREALAAIDGTVALRNEGDGGRFAALGTNGLILLAGGGGTSVLAGVAALLAAGGLVLEAFFSVEFLLTGGEHELGATVAARERFVLIHGLDILRFRMSDRCG
jgi:hypothetical protein